MIENPDLYLTGHKFVGHPSDAIEEILKQSLEDFTLILVEVNAKTLDNLSASQLKKLMVISIACDYLGWRLRCFALCIS